MTIHLIDRPARLATCPRCGHPTLSAVSGGITVHATPAPLSISEEIAERLSGHSAYDVIIYGMRLYLEYRDLPRIRTGRRHQVVAAHGCPRSPVISGTEIVIRPPYSTPDIPPF